MNSVKNILNKLAGWLKYAAQQAAAAGFSIFSKLFETASDIFSWLANHVVLFLSSATALGIAYITRK